MKNCVCKSPHPHFVFLLQDQKTGSPHKEVHIPADCKSKYLSFIHFQRTW
jgi:hypothetical protein